MSNRNINKTNLFSKTTDHEKIICQRYQAIKLKDTQGIHILSTAQNNVMSEAPASRGEHQKIKPAVVMDYNEYKIGTDQSNQC
jgi:hypothetical protein